VDFSDWGYRNGKIFSLLKTAILERCVTEFDYYNTMGELSHRRVEPIQLWFKSKAWYLKAFCLAKNDLRTFKLTRMKNLAVNDEVFSVRDLLASVAVNTGEPNNTPDTTLKLKIASEMTYRLIDEFDEDDVQQNPDGSFTVTVTWPEDEWVYGTILSYGEYIEVLEPAHVREIVQRKAKIFFEKNL
jgi:predicted DNA-binding transcriptional regulator YafY